MIDKVILFCQTVEMIKCACAGNSMMAVVDIFHQFGFTTVYYCSSSGKDN